MTFIIALVIAGLLTWYGVSPWLLCWGSDGEKTVPFGNQHGLALFGA